MTRILAILSLALFMSVSQEALAQVIVGGGAGTPAPEELEQVDPPAHVTVQTATFHSIGMVWDVDGDDTDHNAVMTVRYRKAGDAFSNGSYANMMRIDWRPYYNGDWYAAEAIDTFSGSLMFLTPGTRYQIELSCDDPDETDTLCDGDTYTFTADTRAIPVKPTGGTTYYVDASAGSGGDGSSGDPFDTIEDCDGAVSAGDICLLRDGVYDSVTLDTNGEEDNYIVYAPDPADPGAIIEGTITINGTDHIWIDGLSFRWNGTGDPYDADDRATTSAIFQADSTSSDDVIITGNDMTLANTGLTTPFPGCSGNDVHGQHYGNGVLSIADNTRWVIMDNDYIGAFVEGIGDEPDICDGSSTSKSKSFSLGGEISPNDSVGAIIAYNRATRGNDVGGGSEVSDFYGNLVYDNNGNCVSFDGGGGPIANGGNVRIWGNHCTRSNTSPMTSQPQNGAPWYILYNQLSDAILDPFKFRVQDRMVVIGNTFVGRDQHATPVLYWFSRNNLWIHQTTDIWRTGDSSGGCTPPDCTVRPPIYAPDWFSNLDYDGFDWGGSGRIFWWDNNSTTYSSLAAFAAGVGIEENAVEVDADAIFDDKTVSHTNLFTLASGTNAAVDAGEEVGNLADFYNGAAPDLGPHERGSDTIFVGPRDTGVELDQRPNYWAKH